MARLSILHCRLFPSQIFLTACLVFGASLTLRSGIEHPPLVLYGSLTAEWHGTAYQHNGGVLRFYIAERSQPDESLVVETPVLLRTSNAYNFLAEVPTSIATQLSPIGSGVVNLAGKGDAFFAITAIELVFGGSVHPVAFKRGSSELLSWTRSEWGGARQIDLLVNLVPADSDGDGLPDAYESIQAVLDPGNPDDALLDPDGDLRDNLTEFYDQTNPAQADSPAGSLLANAWATVGVSTVVNLNNASHVSELLEGNRQPTAYLLETAPAAGQLYKRNLNNGQLEALESGMELSDLEAAHGLLHYRVSPGTASSDFIELSYADPSSPDTRKTHVLKFSIWEPTKRDGSDAFIWFDAGQEPTDQTARNSLTNQADGAASPWDVKGRVELDTSDPDRPALQFDKGYAVGEASLPDPLAGQSVSIFASVVGEATLGGPLFASSTHALAALPATGGQPFDFTFGDSERSVSTYLGVFEPEPADRASIPLSARRSGPTMQLRTQPGGNARYVRLERPMGVSHRLALGARVGPDGVIDETFEGCLQELLVFNRFLSPQDHARLHVYLEARWSKIPILLVDVAQSPSAVQVQAPTAGLSLAEYASYEAANGPASAHRFLAWQTAAKLRGGHADDHFYFGGRPTELQGEAGADVFALLIAGQAGHSISDFSPAEGDRIDLASLFPENTGLSLGDHLRVEQSGADALIQVHLSPYHQDKIPDSTLRLKGHGGLSQATLNQWSLDGHLFVPGLRPAITLSQAMLQNAAEEVGPVPARLQLSLTGSRLPVKPFPVPMELQLPAGMDASDVTVTQKVYDINSQDTQSTELKPRRGLYAPILTPGLPLELVLTPVPNQVTDSKRDLTFRVLPDASTYVLSQEAYATLLAIHDGKPRLTISRQQPMASPSAPASFRIEREGSTDVPLTFNTRMEGTATNGVDYLYIGPQHSFAVGQTSMEIELAPLRLLPQSNANQAVLRLEPNGEEYQLDAITTALISLDVLLRELFLRSAQPIVDVGDSASEALFYLNRSGGEASDFLTARLRFEGSVDIGLLDISYQTPSSQRQRLFIDPATRTANIFLQPDETFATIHIKPKAAYSLPGGPQYVLAELLPPAVESGYALGANSQARADLTASLAVWAESITGEPMSDTELQDWLISKNGSLVVPLVAYAIGADPTSKQLNKPATILEPAPDALIIKVPYYEAAIEVRPVIEFSNDLTVWQTLNGVELLGNETIQSRPHRIYRSKAVEGSTFYRVRYQPVE